MVGEIVGEIGIYTCIYTQKLFYSVNMDSMLVPHTKVSIPVY